MLIGAVLLLADSGRGVSGTGESTFTEDTDDAQVDGNIYQISSRVAGQVVGGVCRGEYTPVKKGDLLLEMDPKDYQVALEQAQATPVAGAGALHAGECECADDFDFDVRRSLRTRAWMWK